MPVFFGSGNIITKAKTVRMSSFIYTEASEVDITYVNLFKEYVLDMTDGFTEQQNIYYDPFKYSDYLDRVTSISFDTKEIYSGEMYNTFFDSPEHNLEYVLGSSFNTEDNTNLVNTKYVSEIYQSLDNLLSIGMSYEKIIEKLQMQLIDYSRMSIDYLHLKKDYAISNVNFEKDKLNEIGVEDIKSKQLLDALYFSTSNQDVLAGGLNPLDATLNMNIATTLLIQSRLENFDLNNNFKLERKIPEIIKRNIFEEVVPILQNPESGLYFLEFKDTIEEIDDSMFFDNDVDRVYEAQNLVYGSPNVEYHPINNFFQKYMPTQAASGEHHEVISDLIIETQFYTQEKNDITIDLSPKYISDSDKTFVRSIFYIELDDYQDYLGYVPYVKTSTDTSYIPDEQFIQTKVHTPDKNIFKFRYEEIKYGGKYVLSPTNYFLGIKFGGKYIVSQEGDVFVFYNTTESRYAGYHKDYDTVYEYINDLFLSTNVSSHDSVKPHQTLYYRSESRHPINGGSHLGHTVPHVMVLTNDNNKLMDSEYIKTKSLSSASKDYRVTQVVIGQDSQFNKLFEFDAVYHDLDANTLGDSLGGFNFVYQVVKGRLPNCLSLNNSIVSGNIGETEQFLNQYSYESWVKDQNLEIDTNYEDFNPEKIKQIEVMIEGRATTQGTIDIIDGSGFEIGDTITQRNSSGDVQGTGIVTRIVLNYTREFSLLGADPQDLNIIRYEIFLSIRLLLSRIFNWNFLFNFCF